METFVPPERSTVDGLMVRVQRALLVLVALSGASVAATGDATARDGAGDRRTDSAMAIHATSPARPPHSLRVTLRTSRTITLRWRAPRGAKGKFTIYLNRRVVARTARTSFTYRRLRCGTRHILGVRSGRSRIAGALVRTRPCAPGAGAGGTPGRGGTVPPGSFPTDSGGTGLPARIPASSGATFYVATTGSDDNPGSAAAPWRTVGKALRSLSAGQSAVVRGGTYVEALWVDRGGTANAPITIRAAPGEVAVIDAPGDAALVMASGAQYLRFQGIVFESATGPSSANVLAENGSHHIELLGCEIRGSARQGFYSESGTNAIHIIACNIHDNGGSGPSGLDHNVYLQGTNHLIASSLIRGAGNGYGIQIYPSSTAAIVSASTVVGNGEGGIIVGSEGNGTTNGARIVGNILAFNAGPGLSAFWGGIAGGDNIARGNIGWGNIGGELTGSSIAHEAPIIADPLFLNRSGGDFRVAPGSPALGAGDPSFTPATDLAGNPRPAGSGPDVGAYER